MPTHDLDKENRPPRGMAQADIKKTPKGSTPGRPKRKGNEFFDVGKVGRKTGITLPDKGTRDEHGLEPMEHIFSSPVKGVDDAGSGPVESSGMDVQESSAPSVDRTLNSRKTPRFPPPRTSTPKHTNIGSPKRMSTGQRATAAAQRLSMSPVRAARTQPPPNRVLDFGADTVHKSIESPSPFKPRHTLRRSMGQGRENPFASPEKGDAKPVILPTGIPEVDEDVDVQELIDSAPIMMDDGDQCYDAMPGHLPSLDLEEVQAGAEDESLLVQKAGKSGSSSSSGKKRRSGEVVEEEGDSSISHSSVSEASGRARKKPRGGRSSKDNSLIAQQDGDEAIDPAFPDQGDSYLANDDVEPEPVPQKKTKAAKSKKSKTTAPVERDPNRAMNGSPVKLNDSPSKMRSSRERSQSMGPINHYHLRATTPFEDSGNRTSRFGRNLIQPLKYWANEGRIYQRGEVQGIVRAIEEDSPEGRKANRKGGRRKGAGRKSRLGSIAEEGESSETESTIADEWEEDVGVIAGMVANWDPEGQVGDAGDLVREDLAFAAPSIITREVASSSFKYAKIMTLPFFGSGVVELPPEGFKRAKNSRRMQMCFFVHEGKVLVEVGPGGDKAGAEANQFAISKGGVWVVPRGNNYAITNESRTKTARIFFAQGCETGAPPAAEVNGR